MFAQKQDTATFLHTWLGELQVMFENFAELIPQLETTELNTADRMRLNGSGVRRYGFIEKVFEVSSEFPQFWPPFGEGRKEMDQYVNEIDALRNLLVWFRLYELLRLFWRRPRRTSEEPTEPELMRDVRALMRGKKDGTVSVRNESDQVIKGEKVVIDNTVRKPRGGVKIVEEV